MSADRPGGLGMSIRHRLLNLAREQNQSFHRLLDRFALERYLYRLSRSPHASELVLKGAYALDAWSPLPLRPTRDADFSGPRELSEDRLALILRTTCETDVEPDGLVYDTATIQIYETRAHRAAGGYRASVRATLDGARSVVRIDVGLGDVVVPDPETRGFSSLLGLPAPALRVSPPERIREFLALPTEAALRGETIESHWPPGGPWEHREYREWVSRDDAGPEP